MSSTDQQPPEENTGGANNEISASMGDSAPSHEGDAPNDNGAEHIGIEAHEEESGHTGAKNDGNNRGDGKTNPESTGVEEGKQDKEAGRPFVRQRRKGLKLRDVQAALKASEGNQSLAAKVLGVDKTVVGSWIENHKELFALYGSVDGSKIVELDESSVLVRDKGDIPSLVENSHRAEEMMKQDRELMRTSLKAAGISPGTIEKIRSLDGLATNTGRMVSASLDYTHRLHIFATAALLEEMIYIRETHLRDPNIDGMVKVFWQRAFNEIADLLGKANDRTMNTASALAAMMKSRSKDQPGASANPKGKPGW